MDWFDLLRSLQGLRPEQLPVQSIGALEHDWYTPHPIAAPKNSHTLSTLPCRTTRTVCGSSSRLSIFGNRSKTLGLHVTMHERTTVKHILNLLLVLMMTGCASYPVFVRETKIEDETRLKELDEAKLDEIIHLNRSKRNDIFISARAITVNGYKILYNENADQILIVKNDVVVAGVSDEGENVTVYKDIPYAPSYGSARAIISDNFIKYSGDKYTFEDFGFNGVNVAYENSNLDQAKSFVPGKTCKTLTARVACCKNEKGKFTDIYRFNPQNGWKFSEKSSCQGSNDPIKKTASKKSR